MKKSVRWVCGLLFMALCAATLAFLHQFTVAPQPMRYILWQSGVRIGADGTEEAYDTEACIPPDAADDCTYRFSAVLPADLRDGYLLFETSGLEITLWLDDTALYRSSVPSSDTVVALAQAQVPLPEDTAGGTLTALCRPLGGSALFPPLLRYTDDLLREADTIAYANLTGIPAGAYGLSFVLVCGLFLLGVVWKKPDWSLLPLALAALGLTLQPIARACGYYFLPAWFNEMIAREVFCLAILLALAAYLVMNRRRDFWRLFGWCALGSGILLLAFTLLSLGRDGYLARYIHHTVRELFQYGIYSGLGYWLSFWMVAVCAMISGYTLTRSVARTQADAQALAMREQLASESYRLMEQKLRETAALRHEASHQLVALDALYRKGDIRGLGEELERLTQHNTASQPTVYTANPALNAILQNATAQAADAGIHFSAVALTPKEMRIPESDLCGFLMNMLDNAIDAARKVEDPAKRFVRFHAELNGNFLALRCENSYGRALKLSEKGWPQTTKAEPELHGFGIRQMREIAEKYGSILDFTCTDDSVTVQTALCLPESGAARA